jgi:DNA-dependent RNA polymerase auxiliary subunit epsilon
MNNPNQHNRSKNIYVTLSGLPLSFQLEWPFHKSTSGADFWVLHGDIHALRKEVDRRQLEFVKSGKLVPVNFSSRYFDFKRNRWVFGKATDEDIATLISRKVFWQTHARLGPVWIADPTEALYIETTSDHVIEVARKLVDQELMTMEGEYASANASLMALAARFEQDARAALEELEKKHAFERG